MRIWSLHPKYLDRKGLLACWRETLLAQKVIMGKTKGYRQHPQLIRFRACSNPVGAVAAYLVVLADEAEARGYVLNRSKITTGRVKCKIPVAQGQLFYEWVHLKAKLTRRDPLWLAQFSGIDLPECHPMFVIVAGGVESWEKVA
jgi:hypothetical protein